MADSTTTPLTLQEAVAKGMTFGQWDAQSGIDQGNGATPGFAFTSYKGQPVLGATSQENANLGTGAAMENAALGTNLSAFSYDKQINPATYQARWNADGTPNYAGTAGSTTYQAGTGKAGIVASAAGQPMPTATSVDAGAKTTTNASGLLPLTSGAHRQGGIVGSAAGGYTPWTVTPEQTVQGRIEAIINPNNPIIAQARSQAVDAMNSRGLTNSSLATTAADAAGYQVALPIAQADAATFAKASGYDADIQNQIAMQKAQLANQLGIATMQTDAQKQIAQLNADTTKYTANLDAQTRTTLQTLQNQNQLIIQTNSQAATIFNQGVAAISTIQNNDKMDATSKTQAIAQIIQNLNNQLAAMSKAAGVNVTMNLANYPGFDANGNYIGFGGTHEPANDANPHNPFDGLNVNGSDNPGGA